MSLVWQPSSWTRHQLEERRLAAQLLLRDAEISSPQIAEHFGVTPSTVRSWRRRYRLHGSLEATQPSGRPARLDDAQVAVLIDLIRAGPDPARFPDQRWTTRRVRDLIGSQFGVWYDTDWVGKLLRRWGFSWQKSEKRALERDEERIKAWLEEQLPVLEKKS